MITRYALFEGSLKKDKTDIFRDAIHKRLVPILKTFEGVQEVSVAFTDERDEGAPDLPLILAVTYSDKDIMEVALASSARDKAKEVTAEIFAECFDGQIHHHVTERTAYKCP